MPAKKSASSQSRLDPVNRESSETVYEEGFAARGRRSSIATCPYAETNPFRVIWEAGWHAARIAEADCSALLHSLHRAGLTTALLDLDPLDDEQRFALIDWLDSRPVLVTPPDTDPRRHFLDQRPDWVIMTGQIIPADDDQPELQVIAFESPGRSLPLHSLSSSLLCSGLHTTDGASPIAQAAHVRRPAHANECQNPTQDSEGSLAQERPRATPALPHASSRSDGSGDAVAWDEVPPVANVGHSCGPASANPASIASTRGTLPPLREEPPASEAESRLQDLLRALDDVGVQLVEEQWLAFSDADQHFCTRWVRGRLQGIMSPVPYCLLPYATTQLKAEYAPYIDECRPTRSERLPITFDKPGVIAAGDDDDEGKIKLIVKAPYEHLPGALADRLFRDTTCRIHFSTRRPSQWDQQELFAAHPIYVTQSDIKGYKATSDDTSFSFTVDQQTLSIESAFKHLWGHPGTAIVERISRATKAPKALHTTT